MPSVFFAVHSTGYPIPGKHDRCLISSTARDLWEWLKKKHKLIHHMLQKLNKSPGGFTLVEIMIVVAIIALLAAIAVPNFLRARKRSQATRILADLRMIDSAIDQYAIETNKASGAAVAITDWTNYLKKGSVLYNTGADLFTQS